MYIELVDPQTSLVQFFKNSMLLVTHLIFFFCKGKEFITSTLLTELLETRLAYIQRRMKRPHDIHTQTKWRHATHSWQQKRLNLNQHKGTLSPKVSTVPLLSLYIKVPSLKSQSRSNLNR